MYIKIREVVPKSEKPLKTLSPGGILTIRIYIYVPENKLQRKTRIMM